jgi:type VI secretion system secreted protein Hcp
MADIYAFLELEGIEGESQDPDYQNKIELQSFSWGGNNNSSFASGTGPGIGKGIVHDMHFSKFTDKASLKLFERCVNGKPLDSGKLTLLKLDGDNKVAYFQVDLTNIVVTSWQLGASGGGTLPSESFSLSFVQFQSHYKPQGNQGDPAGNVDFGWNLQQNASA